jgi:5-oxoprolinase (ATP-hydrolysing) subunit C
MNATLTILSPGLCSLVVDAGRPRSRSLGVPVGGAADRFAWAIGNALVGNAPDAAALEVCLAGPSLVADADLACVLFGAPFEIATESRSLTAGTTFTLHAGETLRIGGASSGARAYLCVRGGIQTPVILGSRTSLTPLQAGERLPCLCGTIASRFIDMHQEDSSTLRVLKGGQADWFVPDALGGQSYEVTPASSRMGVRLRGEPLVVAPREMTSEPVCPGAIQVTRDGQCILLGVDGQTIGGYPKVAHVIGADHDRVGQLRPGARVRFEYVSVEEAEELSRRRSQALREWLLRLRTMDPSG